jgi:hypothetical protein
MPPDDTGDSMVPVRRPLLVGLVAGVALGVALPALVLGLVATHQDCVRGDVLGWSGHLAVPLALGVPPPGGFVNWSFAFVTHSGPWSSSGRTVSPSNSTEVQFMVVNWTAYAESPVTTVGWGPSPACPPIALGAPNILPTGCSCILTPGVAGGVGVRTAIPSQGAWGADPTPLLNGSYPASPVATFSWNITHGDLFVTFLSGASRFLGDVTPYQSYHGAPYSGLALQVHQNETDFGIPVHLLNGTTLTLPSGTPQWLSGSTLTVTETYIFPGANDNQTWAMYVAGGGSPYPLGGYLFEQVN